MRKLIAAVLLLPALWLGWRVYDASVRWGTSDPCEMVAHKVREPAGLGRLPDRFRASITEDLREDGALACWGSALFDVETESEHRINVVIKAGEAFDGWNSGDEEARTWARLSASTDPEVIDVLLSTHGERAVPFLLDVLEEAPHVQPDLEAAVQHVCGTFWISEDDEKPADCRRRYRDLLSLDRRRPLG